MHQHARLRSIALLALVTACTSSPPAPAREQVTALRGTITGASGAPLSGVSASAGTTTVSTDANGRYDLRVAAGEQVVTFEHDGYVRTFEHVSVVDQSPTQLDVTLLAMAAAIPLDASAGGSVTAARGATIVAPAMAFVDPDGAAVTGTVQVHLTPIDPSDDAELAAAPGDFTAEMAGTRVALESFGMMDITVEQDGDRLQVAPGATLEIRIPVAADATAPATEVPVWSLDEATGLWTGEGMATLDAASGTYVATTHHMSLWNIDSPYPATCLCGHVVERGAGPLPGARVTAEGLDYYGTSEVTTNALGRFCLPVRNTSRVSVSAYHAHGGGASVEVTTGDAPATVPVDWSATSCADLGTIEVQRDVFTTSTGTTECTSVSNPFADACGSALFEAFGCFRPSGACTYRIDSTSGSVTTTYANGARSVTSQVGTDAQVQTFGADGALCVTQTVGPDEVVHYTTADGTMFTMTVPSGASGDLVIGCPDGSSLHVTPSERQALEACSTDRSEGGMSAMCTAEATGGPTSSACTASSECTTMGDVCCTITGAGSYCLPSGSCP